MALITYYVRKHADEELQAVEVEVRPEVALFAIQMEQKLAKKDGKKTHWSKQSLAAIRRFLNIEVQELDAAMEFLSLEEQMGECVDVANYGLILWDRLKLQIQLDEAADRNDIDDAKNRT